MSEFINNILGDVYSQQIYIGSDEYGNKLLTRNEVIDQITDSVAEINKNLDVLVENSSNLVTLAQEPLFTKIKDAANRTFSLFYSNNDNTITLNKSDGNSDTVSLKGVQIFDLCNYYDLTNFYIQK
jgi:hypothetical protein